MNEYLASSTLRSRVVPTVFADGAVLLDLKTKFFYQLNSTGWAIVQLFETNGIDAATVLERSRSWGCPETETDKVRDFLGRLAEFDLLEASQSMDAPSVDAPAAWVPPSVERQSEPLHRLVTSAFDPSIPLAE